MKKPFRVAAIVLLAVIMLYFGYKVFWNAAYPIQYQREIEQIAKKYDLEPALVLAVVKTESSFDSDAVSHAGAMGLMQITMDTFYFISQKGDFEEHDPSILFEPEQNIEFGCWFLRYLIDDFDGEVKVALAAYNAGRGNAHKWLNDITYSDDRKTLHTIPFEETRNYVVKVTKSWDKYKDLYKT